VGDSALPPGWGLQPVLCSPAGVNVPSYEVLLLMALAVGAWAFLRASRSRFGDGPEPYLLLAAAVVGAALGAKLPVWLAQIAHGGPTTPAEWLTGRTVLGGIAGGAAAVILVRRRLGIHEPLGNAFAPGLALGMAIGRVGCLFRGCCYGEPTGLPWAIDLGDHVARHPTQAYEALFCLALAAWLRRMSRSHPAPGALFRLLVVAYGSFRFLIEFLRAGEPAVGGLTLAQVACLALIAIVAVSAATGAGQRAAEPRPAQGG
jgi:phosphatidylglycerol:prolipoprotein diacylglycerol transferase